MAEYEALIKALELAKPLTKEVECYLDSELVVKQLLGEYRVKNPRLFELFVKVQKLENHLDQFQHQHLHPDLDTKCHCLYRHHFNYSGRIF